MKTSLLLLALGSLLLIGCSPSKTVTDGEGNKATVSGDGSKMTFEGKDGEKIDVDSKDGKTTWKMDGKDGNSGTMEAGNDLTEAELGLPFYPGSTAQDGSAVKMDTEQGSVRTIIRKTADAPSKVVEFYKPKLKESSAFSSSSGGDAQEMVSGKLEDGRSAMVSISKGKDDTETTIGVTVTQEKKN